MIEDNKDKIEKLQEEYNSEDNDLRAQGIYNKLKREKNLARVLPQIEKLQEKYDVEEINGHSSSLRIKPRDRSTRFPDLKLIVDYYPKANEIFIHETQEWISNLQKDSIFQYISKILD